MSLQARPLQAPPLQLEEIRWRGWDAIRCVAGDCELIVVISVGPRILSLRWGGGENLLHLDTTDFRVGKWRFHGGHRFTVAPENPDSYAPDNSPCETTVEGNRLTVATLDAHVVPRRVLEISAAADGAGFDLLHHLENRSDQLWQGAAWAVTAVPATGCIVSPHCSLEDSVCHWPSGNGFQGRIALKAAQDHIIATPNGGRAKAGWHSHAGWLAWLRPEWAFVIHAPEVARAEECVDGGCNIEVFTCSDYLEMETLGPKLTLPPGEGASHQQRWRLVAGSFTPTQWPEIARRAGCAYSVRDSNQPNKYAS